MTTLVPSWLYSLPGGPAPNLPVETRGQVLPFGDLTWTDFERLTLRLVRREGKIVECSVYGTPGQAQDGLDILATHSEQGNLRVCYQCKKVAEFGPASIIAAVDKFLSGKWNDSTREFVLCVAIPLESTQQQDELDRQRNRLSEKSIKLSVWDGSAAGALCERLKALPDLVDDFFGRGWVERFNGQAAAASLGERLNGYELGALQNRLLSLYSVLFVQHDPGLGTDGDRSPDYRERYVTADVTERTEVGAVSANLPVPGLASHEDGPDGDMHRLSTIGSPTGKTTTYETRRPVFEWLRDQEECVVLGEPGYGKSAMLRYLALSILLPDSLALDSLNPTYFSSLPVWISFARFSATIDRQHDISVDDFFRNWLHQYSFDDIYPLFVRAARSGQVLLLVDGLDEASAEQSGREALDRIVTFRHACNASIICTSRPRGYKALGVPASWATATLTPMSDQKIEELAARWFTFLESGTDNKTKNGSESATQSRSRAQAFLSATKASPKTLELARNPLLCQALIQLFRFSHQLPEARVTAYKQIVELLLSKHPAARAQAGGTLSSVGQLGVKTTDLNEILIRLAWALQTHQPSGPLNRAQCEQVCAEFLEDDTFGFGESRAKARRLAGDIIEQLVTHYGVLVERAPNELNFLHLSIQEYLAAEFVARLPSDDQLAWLSKIWASPAWHESLISWYGILGARGDKVLAGRASQYLAELGEAGEWQRMQSLELRAEIATADLGLPVNEARRVIEQAASEVEESAFVEFRTALARSITLGALSTPVRSECQSAIRRWLPGQSSSKRVALLESFKTWEPSNTLRSALLRAFQDQEGRCRRAAAEAFSAVFSDAEETLPTLRQLATHHVQPEVRAAALHGLGNRAEWADAARESAVANIESTDADLLLVVLRIQIWHVLHNDEDLERVWQLWTTDAVDFWFRHELVELLCSGWPQHSGLRKAFIDQLRRQSSTANIELPLEYLIRCYPGDDEIAGVVAEIFKRFGRHFSIDQERIWEALQLGFQGHKFLSTPLREMLKDDRDKYKSIFWGPQTVPAMVVLGDEEARDDLLTSYDTADLRSRYWIATALFRGWIDDEAVKRRLKEWANGEIGMAAPLARWAENLMADVEQRQQWLRGLARETVSTREIGAIMALFKTFPDKETKHLAEEFLEHPKI